MVHPVLLEVFLCSYYEHWIKHYSVESVPTISIVTISDAKQGKQHHKRKLLLRFTVIIGLYCWVGVSNWLQMFLSLGDWKKCFVRSCVTVGLQETVKMRLHFSWSRLVSHRQGLPHPVCCLLSLSICQSQNIIISLYCCFWLCQFLLHYRWVNVGF